MIGSTFAKTICSICYEDLKPIVEDLQSISICGHVFHELCLQQWFEYSASKRKKSCPVCKQTCYLNGVNRLYFQSIGDASDPIVSQNALNLGEDPGVLRKEVKILEVKVEGLTSALERNQNDLKELNEELCLCKEQFKEEVALKNEALKQKVFIQQLLYSKSQDLDKSNLESLRLQERNMALAKELAALKLVSDLNLDEEGVLKLASFGNEANNKDTIDILKRENSVLSFLQSMAPKRPLSLSSGSCQENKRRRVGSPSWVANVSPPPSSTLLTIDSDIQTVQKSLPGDVDTAQKIGELQDTLKRVSDELLELNVKVLANQLSNLKLVELENLLAIEAKKVGGGMLGRSGSNRRRWGPGGTGKRRSRRCEKER